MPLADTHCHLNILNEKGIDPITAMKRAAESGVDAVVQIATDLKSSLWNRDLANALADYNQLPDYYWCAGIHPEAADDLSQLDELFHLIRSERNNKEFLGIGETGLDYFHTVEHIENQIRSFEAHLELAKELNLPLIVHLRDDRAYNPQRLQSIHDALKIVQKHNFTKGVLHCYTYTHKEAAPFVEMGWMVSYSGIITYKNATAVQEGALNLPLSCLMVETDAPFLAPVPHRGETNEPSFVPHTLDFLVNLRATKLDENQQEIRSQILLNIDRFLNWKGVISF